MNNDINLVGNQQQESLKEKKRLKTVRIAAVVSLIVISLMSLIIFILYSSLSLGSIKNDQNSTLNSISYLHSKAAQLAIVNNRLVDISNVLSKRKNYTNSINILKQQMPPGVTTSQLSISNGNVTFVVSSQSLDSLNTFLNNIISLAQKQQTIDKIYIESLVINTKTGSYSLSIKASLL